MFELNDYELIYLIRDNNEIALDLLYKKYVYLIYHYIKLFNVYGYLRDDFIQEGYLALEEALINFDESRGTFFNYAEIVIKRKMQRHFKFILSCAVPTDYSNIVLEEPSSVYNEESIYDKCYSYLDDDLDKFIYEKLYKEGLKCKDIALKYNIKIKKIYNRVAKIKKYLKENVEI